MALPPPMRPPPPPSTTLLRRHVGRLLSEYYAQPSHKVVGSTVGSTSFTGTGRDDDGVVDFKYLLGEWHYRRRYRQLYDRQDGQWLTPVELFKPHYSRIVAEFVARCAYDSSSSSSSAFGVDGGGVGGGHNDDGRATIDGPIDVVELGGGRGTNAGIVLSHLRDAHPAVYDALDKYTVIDSSPALHGLQGDVLLGNDGRGGGNNELVGEHAEKVRLLLRDASDVAEGKAALLPAAEATEGAEEDNDVRTTRPTVAIALELLDNLPHDKVRRDPNTGAVTQAEVAQAEDDGEEDEGSESSSLAETFAPLSDPLLRSVVDAVPFYASGNGKPRWVPTVACGLLRQLYKERPNSSVLMADFDWLPPPDLSSSPSTSASSSSSSHRQQRRRRSVEAVGEPLITDMNDVDHPCYLSAPSHCDILFPTDFGALADFVDGEIHAKTASAVFEKEARVMKQSDFLAEYGPSHVKETRSVWTGFNPMLEDFSNYSILLVSPSPEYGESGEGKSNKKGRRVEPSRIGSKKRSGGKRRS